MVAERLKKLRTIKGVSQSELSKRLGVTRSSVNAWEMGISCPTMQYIIDLANYYDVTTDYLLGLKDDIVINISGYSQKQQKLIFDLLDCLKQDKE